jgi:hypothetical protein
MSGFIEGEDRKQATLFPEPCFLNDSTITLVKTIRFE